MLIYYNTCIAALAASTSGAFAPQQHNVVRNNNNAANIIFAAIANTRGGTVEEEDFSSTTNPIPSPPPAAVAAAPALSKLDSLLAQSRQFLKEKNADGAFATLAQAYGIDPTSSKTAAMFEACLGLKVELAEENYYLWKTDTNLLNRNAEAEDGRRDDASEVGSVAAVSEKELNDFFQDRMGLSSLFIDREHYDEAGVQLRKAIEEATFWLNRSLQSSSTSYDQESTNNNNNEGSASTAITDFSSTQFNHWQPQLDRARYLLYRTNAACCHWDTYFQDGDQLRQSLLLRSNDASPSGVGMQQQQVARLLHPFDALKFPCMSLELASGIARSYACRALETVGSIAEDDAYRNQSLPRSVVTACRKDDAQRQQQQAPQRKIRIGYISPDFTSRHPLAFLMQHVFRCHDKSRFAVNIYSVSSSNADEGPEVRAIRESSDEFTYLSPSLMSPMEMYQRMMQDELDVLVDLCGYAGTSVVSEIMASRCRLRQDDHQTNCQNNGDQSQPPVSQSFPMHVSYMGFPGSVGSSRVWDYSVFDPIVIPPEEKYGIRKHYDEALVYMPHCYFVNSHKTVVGGKNDGIMLADEDERRSLRAKYGIHPSAFVYCCHSRPDKIDPSTFRSWMNALLRIRSASSSKLSDMDATMTGTDKAERTDVRPVLWLLRSGNEMEQNLRQWVRREFGNDAEDCLVFADVADRHEHLKRLGIADVFLDTPAYNAHTLGCDALYMGVPMISLLRSLEQINADDTINSKVDSDLADDDLDSNHHHVEYEVRSIATEKLASRVGASLLEAIGLRDLVYSDMAQYEDAMVRCALDEEWFSSVGRRLLSSKESSPLFDTKRWVENLEAAFYKMVELGLDGGDFPDILVSDNEN